MAENTDNTQQGSGQLIPIVAAVLLVATVLVLFLLWQDTDSKLGTAEEEGTAIAQEAEDSANLLLTATYVLGTAVVERDTAQAEATEAVGQVEISDSLAGTAESARVVAETAQADSASALATADTARVEAEAAQALLEIAERNSNQNEQVAVATAEFAVIVQGTMESVAGTQVIVAQDAQATAQSALDYQETAVAVAAVSITERDEALRAQETAQFQANEAQTALDGIQDLLTMNAARLNVILNQLATAEAQNAQLEAQNIVMGTAIADGSTPIPPTRTPGPTITPGGPTSTPGGVVAGVYTGGVINYTSDDESYSFAYPDSWFFVADLGDDTVAANTVDASVEITGGVPSSGNFWMYVGVFNLGAVGDLASFLPAAVAELRPNATLSATSTFTVADYGDPVTVAYVDLIGENNRLLIADLGGGMYGFLDIRANADEVDSFMPEILLVANTLSVSGQ